MKSCFTLPLHIPHSPEREEAEPPEHDVSDTDPSALAHPPAETGRRSETCWCAQVFSERFTGEMSSQSSSITNTYNNEPPPCCLWAGQCSSVFSWPIRTWTSATMKHLDDTFGLSYCSHRGAEGVGGWGDQLEVIYSDSQWASNNNYNPHNQHTSLDSDWQQLRIQGHMSSGEHRHKD